MLWNIPAKAYYPSIHLQTLANLYEVAALDITASFATVLSIPPSAALLTLAGITHLQRTVSASPHPQNPLLANRAPAVRSGKWVAGFFTRHVARAESQLEARDSEDNCVPASTFVFTHDGTTTVLNVPEGSTGQVVDLAAKGDYAGLKSLGKDWICKTKKFLPPHTDIVLALTISSCC